MRAEPTRRVRRRGFGCSAALWLLSCSVFPDHAVLPAAGGSGGEAPTGGASSFGGASGGRSSAFGGDASAGAPASSGGEVSQGGEAGWSGSPSGGVAAEGGRGNGGHEASSGAAGATGGTDATGGATGGTNAAGGATGGTNGATGGTNAAGGATGGTNGATGGTNAAGGASCASPVTWSIEASADAYLSELAGEQKSTFGQDPRLRVGGLPGERLHSVLAFNLSALSPTTAVLRASLRLDLGAAATSAHTVYLYALSDPFKEKQVSWERSDQGSPWLTPGGDTAVSPSSSLVVAPSSAGTVVRVELGDDVQAIARSERPNNGWLLSSADGEPAIEFVSRESSFADERPVLEITSCP